MAQIIICMECGTPLRDYSEPCPNCMPSIAWRARPISTCNECKKLKEQVIKLKQKIALLTSMLDKLGE